jgi:MFS family permease
MLQEIFGGRLIDAPHVLFTAFDDSQKRAAAAVGAGFVGAISLFNIGGRFFWASLSDRVGRKPLYAFILALGALLYGIAAPALAGGSIGLFILTFCICASMYGGGFSTVPAYLADIFGTRFVGAIHGRLLTAWSTAGVLGPLVVANMRDARIAAGIPRVEVYQPIYWTLAAMLVAGFIANLLVKPVHARFHMAEEEPALAVAADAAAGPAAPVPVSGGITGTVLLTWAAVCLPIAWGVYQTIIKAAVLLK